MKRMIKWLAILAFVGVLATALSYGGMRVRVGQLLGEARHEFVARQVTFGRDTIPGVGVRTGWTVTWGAVRMPGTRSATVWVSPTGGIVATEPENLEDRIEAYLRSRDP